MADENAKFQQGNKIFKAQMVRIAKEKNCYRALVASTKDFGKTLEDLNGNFDSIKKSMIQFLDSKRGKFPRFYFLPHEDLLEIIGMGKDPKPLNKHIKKIFAGVQSLEAEPAPKTASAKYYIKAIESEGKEESIELDVGATDQKKLEVEVNCEDWLKELIHRMREALQRMFKFTQQDQQSTQFQRRIKEHIHMRNWVNLHKGQFLVTDCQIRWSNDVRNHLLQLEKLTQVNPNSSSHPLKIMKKQYAKLMATYVDVVEKTPGLSALERKKLTALIIVEEHHRDVIDKLCSFKNISRNHFAWLQQLRFTLKEPEGADNLFNVEIEQMNSVFDYGYEYQGNQPRLVITELTDRAYMTLTNALSMFRGGAPQGPAGTGKTETVKDLGKNLAFFVLVQNCDNLMTPESLSKIFAGLASSGAWGCFDEFNRISLDVLSVIAVMFEAMFDCQKRGDGNSCQLGEIVAAVSKDAGFFITMNPGYAGRSALPDNLAALFRPVAMMKADFVAIAKIELMSTGFKEGEPLSVKIVSMYSMMERQLSKAHHYEFQMRSLKSVLRACGAIKQGMPQLNETSVAIKAIRDMNLSKLLPDDVFLFDKLFEDLFPDCEEPEINMDDLQISLEDNLEEMGLELNECMVVKAM
jgi:dynein heavy chain